MPGLPVTQIRDSTLLAEGRSPRQVLEALAAGLLRTRTSAGLVIDGHALALCLLDEDTAVAFLELCRGCTAVVCCRVSPMQKAQVGDLAALCCLCGLLQ
jgi:hypothetical protein